MDQNDVPEEILDKLMEDLEGRGVSREDARRMLQESSKFISGKHTKLDNWPGIQKFMESTANVVYENILRDGKLLPIVFLIQQKGAKGGQMIALPINDFMANDTMKNALEQTLRRMTKELELTDIVMIMEAWVKHVEEDDPLFSLIKSGALTVSQLSSKKEMTVVQSFSKDGSTH